MQIAIAKQNSLCQTHIRQDSLGKRNPHSEKKSSGGGNINNVRDDFKII